MSHRILFLLLAVSAAPAFAHSNGDITSVGQFGCNECHSGGTAPTVTITQTNTAGSATIDLRVTVTTSNSAGLLLMKSQGTFSNAGTGVQINTSAGVATHTAPKAGSGGTATFTVSWSPTNAAQSVTFTAWGNAVNLSGDSTGDAASSATLTCGLWYTDADADGFGGGTPVISCTQPAGRIAAGGDCNDGSASIKPGATETCNGADDNCDGNIDENAGPTWYADADHDTFGNASMSKKACTQPTGYVANSTDCNDGNANIKPGATELCDGIDNNCEGHADEGLTLTTFYKDEDGDGFGGTVTSQACSAPQGFVTVNGDCNDSDSAIKPGATEVCDKKDNNCDGHIDESLAMAVCGVGPCMRTGSSCDPADCVPGMAQTEVCNGADDNCNSEIDDGVPNATCGVGACMRTGTNCQASSCTPGTPGVETCNGIDDDCDGTIDNDPDTLCDEAGLTCQNGTCAPPDAGTPSGTTDGGSDTQEDPASSGGGCTSAGGMAMAWAAAAWLSVLALRRRAKA